MTDWKNNTTQLIGASAQFMPGIRLARAVSKQLSQTGADLSFVGHSLGGGIAEAAVWGLKHSPHREAKVFNSSGFSIATALRSSRRVFDPEIDIQSYSVVGGPLTVARGIDGVLPSVFPLRLPKGESWNLGYRHSMDAILLGIHETFR